mmetsp:Transcript_33943/g.95414  ORF Transcript_33943/g.95414 Transcript_33943/m.95414 type:complete len:217 (+) Transcript_33943:1443-2093(+)
MREPAMTMPSMRLNASTYSAFVDCWIVRAITMAGPRIVLKALKMRVRRMRRSTMKPPPSTSTLWFRAITPGKMAARSIMFDGERTNLSSRIGGDGRLMASSLTVMSRSSARLKTSARTVKQVRRRMRYSRTKKTRQTLSTVAKISLGTGCPVGSSRGRSWYSGTVERMKHRDDTMIARSTTFEMIMPRYEESECSKVRYILSAMESVTMILRFLYT